MCLNTYLEAQIHKIPPKLTKCVDIIMEEHEIGRQVITDTRFIASKNMN